MVRLIGPIYRHRNSFWFFFVNSTWLKQFYIFLWHWDNPTFDECNNLISGKVDGFSKKEADISLEITFSTLTCIVQTWTQQHQVAKFELGIIVLYWNSFLTTNKYQNIAYLSLDNWLFLLGHDVRCFTVPSGVLLYLIRSFNPIHCRTDGLHIS